MKNLKITLLLIVALTLTVCFINNGTKSNVAALKKTHKEHLANSPFKKTLAWTKADRKAQGLPPNKYFEREWELTMNPATGFPEPEKVLALQNKLKKQNLVRKTPGDAIDNPWNERGPDNVGGRVRVVFFDPNDTEHKRVFAGGVSGGLWVIDDITNAASTWTQITDVPGNMNVSCYTIDPRDSNTWYIGTGEQYTAGAVVGNGVYKTTNGGLTWTNIPIAIFDDDIPASNAKILSGLYFVNSILAWDNGSNTELYVGVGGTLYADAVNPRNYLGSQSSGLYRSTDNGGSFSRIEHSSLRYSTVFGIDFYVIPNTLKISADNTIWMGCTSNPGFGNSGAGKVFKSTTGTDWLAAVNLPNSDRVELACSAANPNKIYALTEGTTTEGPHIFKTENGFSTYEELNKPEDSDTGIPANDFTRGQDFYDLVIAVDPTDDTKVYVGGINLFRSTDSGASWSQISKWASSKPGGYTVVHADQHAITFRPDNPNQAVFGNDGGVYYGFNLQAASGTNNAMTKMVKGLNITQFYRTAIAPRAAQEYFLGGTQDNGTPYFSEPTSMSSIDISGGDGAACFVDQVGESYLIVSYVYNNAYGLYDFTKGAWRTINSDNANEGDFINQAALDSNLDMMYTNGSTSSVKKIYRYANLTNIPENGSANKRSMFNGLLDSSPTAITVSPYTTTSSTLLIGTETGKLLRVTNANTNNADTWTDISGNAFVGSISDVEYGNNENELYVTFHNYGVKSIWYSSDGGVTWVDKEGDLPDMPVKTILPNYVDTNEAIIGTELGVWKTENWNDTSPNWVQTYNGMSDVKVTDLVYRKDGHKVLASTFGRGLYSGLMDSNIPTFTISSAEVAQEIIETKQVEFSIDYQVFAGYDENVTASLSNAPIGANVTYTPAQSFKMDSNGALVVTISPNQEYESKTYEMTLQLAGATVTKTINFSLKVDLDIDKDGVPSAVDNCIEIYNPDQSDIDGDGKGDVCDDDMDGDGKLNANDNCPSIYNPDQSDIDGDGKGDLCDDDMDGDQIINTNDNCPTVYNPDQLDADEDGIGDVCDDAVTVNATPPKGFTPNGDGINDNWTVEKLFEMYPNNSLEIYSKDGQLVYRAKPYKNDWDGYSNMGTVKKLPVGSYTFILRSGDPALGVYPAAYVKQGWIYIKY